MPKLPFFDYQVTTSTSPEITLLNDQPTPVTIATFDTTVLKSSIIEYSVVRSGTVETGRIQIATDGVTLSFELDKAENNPTGIILTCDLSGSNLLLQYVSNNTGQNAAFKYAQRSLS